MTKDEFDKITVKLTVKTLPDILLAYTLRKEMFRLFDDGYEKNSEIMQEYNSLYVATIKSLEEKIKPEQSN